jgi:hypothetical protein
MAKKAISGYDVHSELYPLSDFSSFGLELELDMSEICLHLPGYFLIYTGFCDMIFVYVTFSFLPFGICLLPEMAVVCPQYSSTQSLE